MRTGYGSLEAITITEQDLRQRKETPADIQMRVKLGQSSRSPNMDQRDDLSIPSDLSDDLWGELPRYQAMKLKEQQAKEKNEM